VERASIKLDAGSRLVGPPDTVWSGRRTVYSQQQRLLRLYRR